MATLAGMEPRVWGRQTLVALRRLDQAADYAARLVQPDPYLEPFALRTQALARRDDDLLARAVEGFEALGLQWHASRTWSALGAPPS
jgi:hypothetical protein